MTKSVTYITVFLTEYIAGNKITITTDSIFPFSLYLVISRCLAFPTHIELLAIPDRILSAAKHSPHGAFDLLRLF